jgi:DNA invertase Pin-like site-specific DNA recombinase
VTVRRRVLTRRIEALAAVQVGRSGKPLVHTARVPREEGRVRVIGYVRVSTEEQAISGLGLEAQRSALREAWKHREGRLVSVLSDEGYSGKDLDRPGLTEALQRIADGRADALAVVKLDRLTRNSSDLGELIEWFQYARGGLIALDFDGLDTTKASGRMIATVIVAVAQWERDSTAERTKAALAALRARGKPTGRPAVEDIPALAARIREMRKTMTLQGIADRLNDEGVPTIRGGSQWRRNSVATACGYKRRPPRRKPPDLPDPRRR